MKNNIINTPVKNKILGVGITNETSHIILKYLDNILKNTDEKIVIVTPNPEIIVYANKHPEFKKILNAADIALPDGVGVMLSGIMLGQPFAERIPGVDFMKNLCEYASKNAVTVGFLGGRNAVADVTAKRLQEEFPNLKVVFTASDIGSSKINFSEKYKVSRIKYIEKEKILNTKYQIFNTKLDILFVAFGFPKQEEWMYLNRDKLNVRVMMGVGGAFDYLSGSIPRAPLAIRKIGLEWLFRLIIQPWRWRRQLALVEFGWLVMKEKFTSKNQELRIKN